MQSRGHYVGVEQNGQPVIKNKTGIHTKFWVIIDQPVSLKTYNCRAVQLINNHDYWEIIDVMTIIMMSIIDMVNKKSHQRPSGFDAKCNI